MAQVKVKTAELVLRTVTLSKSILKQILKVDYRGLHNLGVIKDGKIDQARCVGWIHGSVMGDEFGGPWVLLIGKDAGEYYLYNIGAQSQVTHLLQIYVA